jgi:dihydrofolate synthase/folylpolyglutamate synthase
MDELRYLDSLQGSGIRPGLSRVKALLRAAGNPQRRYPSILVAGTNGKGSTSATLASILEQSGLRTGLYTSPHLVKIEERWRIDGRNISEDLFRQTIRQLRAAARRCGFSPTYFEALTVMAYMAFAEVSCEVAVMEVGMGGRLDATNVVTPIASVISRIGIDHTEYLGNTIRKIAREKAGIIHRGSIAVTSNDDPVVVDVLERRASRCGTTLHVVSREVKIVPGVSRSGARLRLRTPLDTYELRSPLSGAHQGENIALAVRAAELLTSRLPGVTSRSIARGVLRTVWRGRLERFHLPDTDVWVDGAHNVQAVEALVPFIEKLPRPRTLVFGVMRDKSPRDIAALLFPLFDDIFVTEPPDARATDAGELRAIGQSLGKSPRVRRDPRAAVREAAAGAGGPVLVAGSLYLAGSAIEVLDRMARPAEARSRSIDSSQAAKTKARRRPNSIVITR